jgi:hypothetical protein
VPSARMKLHGMQLLLLMVMVVSCLWWPLLLL